MSLFNLKKVKKSILLNLMILVVVGILGFFVPSEVLAQANELLWGGTEGAAQNASGLGNTDIRIVIANIIRIFLGFLGIIAVIMIIYAGWLWMTSAGDAGKVDLAKKTLLASVIGMAITLSSFAIASFILNKMLEATGGAVCDADHVGDISGCNRCMGPAPFTWQYDNGIPGCDGGVIPGPGGPGAFDCDLNPLTPLVCDINQPACDLIYGAGMSICDPGAGCTCQPLGGYGDPCDLDTSTATCEAGNNMCMAGLKCDDEVGSPTECTCIGAPVIDYVSPVGGFCEDDENMTCTEDSDCGTTCDIETPNGAVNNIISIGGWFFGTIPGTVVFVGDEGNPADDVLGIPPSAVNAECTDYWNDDEIIIVVPSGALEGPIRVVRDDTEFDITNNDRGEMINDFVVNTIERPGLCLARATTTDTLHPCYDKACGYFEEGFNLQGVSFDGALQEVLFGVRSASTTAESSDFLSAISVNAVIPNLKQGKSTVFVEVDGEMSNFMRFNIYEDLSNEPYIEYIDPDFGPPGEYITIHGGNFKNYDPTISKVIFKEVGNMNVELEADGLSFPEECRDKWWNDKYITVMVPALINSAAIGDYEVRVTNVLNQTSEAADFEITAGSPGPGICLLKPRNGPIGFSVKIIGGNFGDTRGSGFVKFFNNKTDSSIIDNVWNMQDITVNVPVGAESGPVNVSNGTKVSNSLPFHVGYCSTNAECESYEECCGGGTYWSGICRNTGTCDSGGLTLTGYGWSINTGSVSVPPPTCGGIRTNAACIAFGGCPNAMGVCATRDAIPLNQECNNDACNNNYSDCVGQCAYDNAKDKCRANAVPLVQICEQNRNFVLGGVGYDAKCVPATVKGNWQFSMSGATCPVGSFMDINGMCTVGTVLNPTQCEVCSDGFYCDSGQCFIGNEVCGDSASCVSEECILDSGICECCCRTDPLLAVSDCCFGLTCEPGGCGNPQDTSPADTINDYGQCSGCRVEMEGSPNTVSPAEQLASDQACNCEGVSGKYCEISNPGTPGAPGNLGVCKDKKPCDSDVYTAGCSVDNGACDPFTEYCNPATCFCDPYVSCDIDNNPSNGCNASGICPGDQYCRDADCVCVPYDNCDIDDDPDNGCQATGSCPLGQYCADDCLCKDAVSCDNDNDFTFGCDASSNCTDIGMICSLADGCICVNSPGIPGDPCDTNPGAAVECDPLACGLGYECLSNAPCGSCCCNLDNAGDPDDSCKEITPNLACAFDNDNTSACYDGNLGDSKNFGICCGCSKDQDCVPGGGDPIGVGCGSDTCCRERPIVNSFVPADDSVGVCRNPSIQVEFSQKMDAGSFSSNAIVVGDYGTSTCKVGTQYLTVNDVDLNRDSLASRLFYGSIGVLSKFIEPMLFSDNARAYTNPSATRNYCAVTGTVRQQLDASGNGILVFSPDEVLDENRTYYVVLKGDTNLNDELSEGIRSSLGISMNPDNFINGAGLGVLANPANRTFNKIMFPNSFVWSFTTGTEICELDHVVVNPESKLFKKANVGVQFDAEVFTSSGESIAPIAGVYDWEWSWDSDNVSVANVTNSNNASQIVTAENVDDGRALIRAKAEINADTVFIPSTVGKVKAGKAQVFVFLCENPWPPEVAGLWAPWRDASNNCTATAAGCGASYNYEFYYCRDSGGYGTYDDLPAVASSSIIRGVTLRCTDGISSCAGKVVGDACGAGTDVCAYEVLKEAYFFREETPVASTTLTAVNEGSGDVVTIGWTYDFLDVNISSYKVYWGDVQGEYTDYALFDMTGTTAHSDFACSFANPGITCDVGGLSADKYYFNLTSMYYDERAESELFGEVAVELSDTKAPAVPSNFATTPADGMVGLSWDKIIDAKSYKLYYGAVDNTGAATDEDRIYGSYSDIGDNSSVVLKGLTNNIQYYFAIKAVDASGNESNYSPELSAMPNELSSLTTGALDEVIIVWDVGSAGSTYKIFYDELGSL